jgi:hypothetical protein
MWARRGRGLLVTRNPHPTHRPTAQSGELVDVGTEDEFLFFTGRRWAVSRQA